MSVLYPRLLPGETERRFAAMSGRSAVELEEVAGTDTGRATYAATGGTRVTRDELTLTSKELLKLAVASGYPHPPTPQARNDFDRAAGRYLHQRSGMAPGEASQRQVWAYMALVLVPHVCAWRFPMREDGTYVADRFKGTDLTRHTLARMWARAFVLHDSQSDDPYVLLGSIGEADLDQIMARRRALAATPALVRAIVRAHAEDTDDVETVPARAVLRDSLQRLLRLTAFLDLDWLPDDHLLELVREQRLESRKNLSPA